MLHCCLANTLISRPLVCSSSLSLFLLHSPSHDHQPRSRHENCHLWCCTFPAWLYKQAFCRGHLYKHHNTPPLPLPAPQVVAYMWADPCLLLFIFRILLHTNLQRTTCRIEHSWQKHTQQGHECSKKVLDTPMLQEDVSCLIVVEIRLI
jgi:hypothetical protein